MAFRISTQSAMHEGVFEFDGPVRQYALGLSCFRIPRSEGGANKVVVKIVNDRSDGNKVYYQIDAVIDGGPPTTAWCWVACIADVGAREGDSTPDPCATFVDGDGHDADQTGPRRFAEPILKGFDYERRGDGWSGTDAHMFIAMAQAEGRTFATTVDLANGAFDVDFRGTIGEDVGIQSAAVFLQHPGFVPIDAPGDGAMLGGGVCNFWVRGSSVCSYDQYAGRVLVVIRTKAVVVPSSRTEVKLRLSRDAANARHYFWEWQISKDPEHWHRTAVASDELDWSTAALTVTVLNCSGRPIQLTLGDGQGHVSPVGGVLAPDAWSEAMDFSAEGPARNKIGGRFTNEEEEELPDPTFTPNKLGGG